MARAQVESFSQNPSHAEKVVMVRHLQQQIAENLTVGKDSYCTYTVYSYNTYPLSSEGPGEENLIVNTYYGEVQVLFIIQE